MLKTNTEPGEPGSGKRKDQKKCKTRFLPKNIVTGVVRS